VTATTTTAEAEHLRATPPPTPEALALAAELIGRSDLRLPDNTTPAGAAHALARALLAAGGPDSPHGLFLAAALRRRTATERKRNGPRPDDQRAARRLVQWAQVPTHAAVVGEVRNHQAWQVADQERQRRLPHLIERDGALVARFVADFRRRHGRGPSWGTVRRQMRHAWRVNDGDHILRALVREGWLVDTGEPGSLAPGPRALGLTS
jgi:hypothetical protein